jgi:predicted nucleic acid-binding protein
MEIFIDTSAFYAAMDEDDPHYGEARDAIDQHINGQDILICTNYIVMETVTLLQRRLGMDAVRTFAEDVLPILKIEWIEKNDHEASLSALLTANRRQLSLVDCSSFVVMRRMGIRTALAFDAHFREQGFTVIS